MKELEIFKLEERVLFEAAAVAEIVEAADAAQAAQAASQGNEPAPEAENQDAHVIANAGALNQAPMDNQAAPEVIPAADPDKIADVNAELDALIDGVIPPSAEVEPDTGNNADEMISAVIQDHGETISTGRELVVIDSSLKEIDTVLEQLRPEQDVLILEDKNGLIEINEFLNERNEIYSAIHFVTHGDNDGIIINDKIINQQTFDANEWSELKGHLSEDGDILFYGCNIAEKSEGKELIDQIAEVCDADVSASEDTTGISGNWNLEYRTGEINTDSLAITGYQHDLNKYIVSDYQELYDTLEDIAEQGGDHTITISNNITIDKNDDLRFAIENDLVLEIKGLNSEIVLFGDDDVIIFDFYDYMDYQIDITIDNLNFDGQKGAYTAIRAAGVESLTINNSNFERFTQSAVKQESYGGTESLVINGSNFLNNESTISSGCAVSAYEVNVSIEGSYFYNNSSTEHGGALDIQDAPSLIISNTTFERNTAAYDGGAVNIAVGSSGVVMIDNTTFYGNFTSENGSGGSGGALNILQSENTSDVTVRNSTFAKNTIESSGRGSALSLSGKGDAEIINSLLIGEGDSVVANDGTGTLTLSYSFATSVEGNNIAVDTTSSVQSSYTHDYIFGSNDYDDTETHTIAPDAFREAAWSGTSAGSGFDQLGVDRETINDVTDLTGKYTIGAVTASVGLIVTQGDYEVDYTGSEIKPVQKLTLSYADGTEMSNTVSANLSANPDPVLNVGEYTITPLFDSSNQIIISGDIDSTAKNVVITCVAGTLKVNAWDSFIIEEDTVSSTYGETPDLTTSYTITTLDKNTGNDIVLNVQVEWKIDDTVITKGDYSATDHLNANFYEDSLVVESFTVTDMDGNDRTSYFLWDLSTKSELDIAKKNVTVTLNGLNDKVYNGKADDAVFNGGSVEGVVDGESLNVVTAPGHDYGTYNSPNVADAESAEFKVALEAGSDTDLANYVLTVDQVEAAARITPLSTETVIETSGPYYYDGTDQSGTVNAYYVDINGNKIPLEINWNGQTFQNVGEYTITIIGSDPNYALTVSEFTLTMNEAEKTPLPPLPPLPPVRPVFFAGPNVYSDGTTQDYSGTIPQMQAELALKMAGNMKFDNVYTMPYTVLVNDTMLSYSGLEESQWSAESSAVSVDSLKYHPFTIDEPVRELSVDLTVNSDLTNEAGIYSGDELQLEKGADILFKQPVEPLSIDQNPLYIEEGVFDAEDYILTPETVSVSRKIFSMDLQMEEQFRNLAAVNEQQSRKVGNLKSSLEKLLDELCIA